MTDSSQKHQRKHFNIQSFMLVKEMLRFNWRVLILRVFSMESYLSIRKIMLLIFLRKVMLSLLERLKILVMKMLKLSPEKINSDCGSIILTWHLSREKHKRNSRKLNTPKPLFFLRLPKPMNFTLKLMVPRSLMFPKILNH
mgnify:CR=1 FL=1